MFQNLVYSNLKYYEFRDLDEFDKFSTKSNVEEN